MSSLTDPYRAVTWRLAAAKEIANTSSAGGIYPPADEVTHRAAEYLADENLVRTPNRRFGPTWLAVYGAGIHPAFSLYRAKEETLKKQDLSTSGASVQAAELEALVLADRSVQAIAKAVSVDVPTVHVYEKVFFDVRSRLGCRAWVFGEVIGRLHGLPAEKLVPSLARAYGYLTGDPKLVRAFLYGIDASSVRGGRRRGGATGAILADIQGSLAIKAVLAARTVPADGRAFRSILETFVGVADEARKAGAAVGADDKDKYRKLVQDIFEAGPYQYGEDPIPPPRLSAYPRQARVEVANT